MKKIRDKTDQFFAQLKAEDKSYAAYSERFGALANFMLDYELLKGLYELTLEDVAEMLHVRKSTIIRLEAMEKPPKYDLLVKVSKALGDSLYLSPMASMSITLQLDLHTKAQFLAKHLDKDITDMMYEAVRVGIERDYEKLHKELQEDIVAENEVTHVEGSLELAGK